MAYTFPATVTAPVMGNASPTTSNALTGYLQSNAGQSLISAILNGVSNYAQNQQNQQNFNAQLSQNANIAQGQLGTNAANSLLNANLQQGTALAAAAPTGWAQNYEQNQELKALALSKLMNPTTGLTPDMMAKLGIAQPTAPVMPSDWAQVNPFSVSATANALGNRQSVLDFLTGGQAPAIDLSQFTSDPTEGAQLNDAGQQYRQYAANNYNTLANNLMQATNLSRNPSASGGGGGSSSGGMGSMSKGAAALSGAASGAAYGSMVMPGIGTGIGAGVGALIGAFKGGKGSGDDSTSSSGGPIPWQSNYINPYAGGGSIPNFNRQLAVQPSGGTAANPYQQQFLPQNLPTYEGGNNTLGGLYPKTTTGANGLTQFNPTPDMDTILSTIRKYNQGTPYNGNANVLNYGGW